MISSSGTEKQAVGRNIVAPIQMLLMGGMKKGRTSLGRKVKSMSEFGKNVVEDGWSMGHFDFDTKKVHVPPGHDPYVLAHELGHAQIDKSRLGRLVQNKLTVMAPAIAPTVSGAGGALSGYVDAKNDESHVLRDSAVMGAAHAPQLGFEAGASLLGRKSLIGAGASKKELTEYAKSVGRAYGTYALAPLATAVNYGLGRSIGKHLGRRDREKKSSLPTLAMDVASRAKHMSRLGTFAKRTGMAAPEVVNSTNAALAKFTPKALPAAAAVAQPLPKAVARKATPAQAVDTLALSKHLAKSNPDQAIQAGRQYGAKVVGNASVLDRLAQTSFDKLSRRR